MYIKPKFRLGRVSCFAALVLIIALFLLSSSLFCLPFFLFTWKGLLLAMTLITKSSTYKFYSISPTVIY